MQKRGNMKKMYWKNVLLPLLLTVFLAGVAGCQTGQQPGSSILDAPPGTATSDENRIVANMGTINLSQKQVISYLQSLDRAVVTTSLNQDGGLEDLVKGLALRTNVITRAAGQGWLERPEIRSKIEDAQRNILYGLYISEKTEPAADYPDEATVTKVYEANKQRLAADGQPALKPLQEIAPFIKQKLREQQKQVNEQNYIQGLVSSNPITVDMQKLVGFINLSQEQKQQQVERLKEPVASMGDLAVGLGLSLQSLGNLESAQQQQLLNNAQLLQQYLSRLALQYFVLKEAIAVKFNARPEVNNRMEQARSQVIYTTYMQAWSAPESGFPDAALIEESYRKNQGALAIPDRYHLAQIVILKSGDAAAGEAKARQVAAMARAGNADFAALARQYSQDPQSANNGGDAGWLNTQALLPELRQLISGKQPGMVIGPIKFQQGWQIVKILEHQFARQQTLEEVRPALIAAMQKQRRAEKEKQLLEQLLAAEPVTVDKDVLQQLRKQIND
ncbi:MAG: peptidylprolyl isomerase [Gammaproteobacteria bacterium]